MKGPTNSSARPNIRLLNVSVTFDDNPDTSNNTEFPYRASIQADGVSEYMSATVMFSQIQATSGNFATYCQTDEDVVYIYSKTDVGTITIPAVSCDLSVNYINVDNVPTEDSQAVITSGGVYDAIGGNRGTDLKPIKMVNGVATVVANDLVSTEGDQFVYGSKKFRGTEYPLSEPVNGATNTPLSLSFYGGVAGKTNYANVTWLNRNNQTAGFHGVIQAGSDNNDGLNGFRIGLRDRADTTWNQFFHLWSSGKMEWTGNAKFNGYVCIRNNDDLIDTYPEGTTGRTMVFRTKGTNGYIGQMFLVTRENGNVAIVIAKTTPGGTTTYQVVSEF